MNLIELRLETSYAVGRLTIQLSSFITGRTLDMGYCRIVETPPVWEWMIEKDLDYIVNYLKRKGQFVSLTAI